MNRIDLAGLMHRASGCGYELDWYVDVVTRFRRECEWYVKHAPETNEFEFNSAAETRECMYRNAAFRKNKIADILKKLSNKINVLTTEAAVHGHSEICIQYMHHLSSFFPVHDLEPVYNALQVELELSGYVVTIDLPAEAIHISWA